VEWKLTPKTISTKMLKRPSRVSLSPCSSLISSDDPNLVFCLPVILEAAAALGADEEHIKEAEECEGKEDDNRDAMDGVEKEVPRPHKIIEKIYEEATPHLADATYSLIP
jgi:hypothetical protein